MGRVRRRFSRWGRKQRLAAPSRYYGGDGTIHRTTWLDVEVHEGRVVAVWFRCLPLRFKQTNVLQGRAGEMERTPGAAVTGVEVVDIG